MCSMLELFEQTQRTNKYDQQQSLSTTQADTINHHQGKHSVLQTDRPIFSLPSAYYTTTSALYN